MSDSNVTRRTFLSAATVAAAAAAVPRRALAQVSRHGARIADVDPPAATHADPDERSIAELQLAMQSGELTSHTLVQQCLDRIESLDKRGPMLRAVLETNPDALAIADALDAERKSGRVRGGLHGIPVLVKDNIDTADRMTTTAGSLALEGSRPARDAHVAERLRAAGAIILGKTNLSEWANFRSTHSSSGWSGRGGQARNPYALDRTPSGSSSGSAVAVAAAYAPVAVGTETDGSVTSPAAACSLVGMKPTVGLVSRSGIIPIAHSQDTAGPMTRSVADLAVLLTAMAGTDPRDVATRDTRTAQSIDYRRYLDPAGLRGARIGVARKRYAGYSTHADAALADALTAMKEHGAVIVDPADIATAGQFDDAEYEVLLYEFKADLEAYLRGLPTGVRARTLDDLIAFNRAHAASELPYFGQEIFEKAQAKGPLTDKAYTEALAKDLRLTRTEGIDKTMDANKLDCLVAATSGPATLIDLVNGDYGVGGSSSFPAIAGYPDVTVPAGSWFGLPVGISFFGRANSEPVLFRIAYAFEQATKARKKPTFAPTVDLTRR